MVRVRVGVMFNVQRLAFVMGVIVAGANVVHSSFVPPSLTYLYALICVHASGTC